MTSVKASRRDEIEAFAATVELVPGVTDFCMVVDQATGSKLPDGTPSGLGARTRFGPAFVLEGRLKSAPIALYDDQSEARYLFALLDGSGGALWLRKERRRSAIAEAERIEAEQAAITRENARTLARAEGGGGSSRRSPSSARRTGEAKRARKEASRARLSA